MPELSLDPQNGFNRLYYSVRKDVEYSLVRVPSTENFSCQYFKHQFGIDMEFMPIDLGAIHWDVIGTFDADIFAILGLDVTTSRRKDDPPVITDHDIEMAAKYGQVKSLGTSENGLALYQAELVLRPEMINQFFKHIWEPHNSPNYRNSKIAPVWVGYLQNQERFLPQKISHSHRRSQLVVHRR